LQKFDSNPSCDEVTTKTVEAVAEFVGIDQRIGGWQDQVRGRLPKIMEMFSKHPDKT